MPLIPQTTPDQPQQAELLQTGRLHSGRLQTDPWQILGAGSIGCLFAAYLQRAGIAVQLILRTADNLALEQGSAPIILQRDSDSPQLEHIAVPALDSAQVRELQQPLRKLLVCTKAQQTRAAIAAIQNYIDANALIILLQNGMGVREQLADLLPHATILHALTTEGAYQTTRFHIVHAGHGNTVIGAPEPRQQELARAAGKALQCELSLDAVDNIGERLWLKLIVNSIINPLTALHECRNGELPQIAGIDAVITALCTEACAVAYADGQRFEISQLKSQVYQVCRVTAANRSSMLQDLTQRRRSEIDFINGYILRRGAQHAIDCPQQQAVFAALKEREHALGCR